MKTKEFFKKRLQTPLVNPGWSWGAFDRANRRVFLRVWEDHLKPDHDAPKQALLHNSSWEDRSPLGNKERKAHIDAIQNGAEGFAVVYSAYWTGDRWKTTSFDQRFLLRLGKIKKKGKRHFAQVLERVPVDVVMETDANSVEEAEIDDLIAQEISVTDRQALVKARIGQGAFREEVLRLWSYRCAVTGCGVQEVLRASHIKPWSESTDQERLDKYNGIPLLATLDALFDKHLIAFNSQGKMLVSSELSNHERALLLPRVRKLRQQPDKRTARFLEEHAALLR